MQFNTLTCKVDTSDRKSDDPCKICECRKRPNDNTLVINCSKMKLESSPEYIDSTGFSKAELNLGMNNLRSAPSLDQPGYENVYKLNLSYNEIETLNKSILSPNIEVRNPYIYFTFDFKYNY